MCGFERRREEYDAPGALRDPLQSGSNSLGWCNPHQEHRIDTIQAFIEGLGSSEVSGRHFNLWRQTSRVRIAHERADFHPRREQLRDNLAADVAGGASDQDGVHNGYCT